MTDSLSSSDKELCITVVDATEIMKEELGNDSAKGHHINCVNCNKHKRFVSTRQGFTNTAEHWKRFAKEHVMKMCQERLVAKLSSKSDAPCSTTSNGQVATADGVKCRAIANWHRSLHMWIEKITKLNQPISVVENQIEREHVKHGECESTKTVLDAMSHLWIIFEEKTTLITSPVPFCQGACDA